VSQGKENPSPYRGKSLGYRSESRKGNGASNLESLGWETSFLAGGTGLIGFFPLSTSFGEES